jgi:hypothetical protein
MWRKLGPKNPTAAVKYLAQRKQIGRLFCARFAQKSSLARVTGRPSSLGT